MLFSYGAKYRVVKKPRFKLLKKTVVQEKKTIKQIEHLII